MWQGTVNGRVNANPELLECELGPALPLGSSKLAPLNCCLTQVSPAPKNAPLPAFLHPSKCYSALKAKFKGKFRGKKKKKQLPLLPCQD